MTIENQIRYEKIQYEVNREAAIDFIIDFIIREKLISMNIILVKKYYLLINNKSLNKLNLLILHWEKPLKNKQKQLKIKEKNKLML